ncbi:MAG TPA: hypothetical protein VHZ07_22160 [Bryobacteraceae bacterium]|nr:hypothetical protein [Bryobacteraceae bacterium]
MTPKQLVRTSWLVPTLVLFLACLRLCHSGILWADEDYHLAAAVHILNGKEPYRDFWYDKPPLSALYYVLVGGQGGWPLRVLDASYIVLACYLAYCVARDWWGEIEGRIAALLLAFFTTFYLPSAVIPFAPDALMIAPHLAAVYFARRVRPVEAGLLAGLAFLVNAKAVFVLAVCGIFLWPAELPLAFGFVLPLLGALAWLLGTGAWAGYREQVWEWGALYAKYSPVTNPWLTGISRTLDWLGFHAALAAGSVVAFIKIGRMDRWQMAAWIALSFAAVCLGTRFAPHYYLQLLPPMVIAASRGIVLATERWRRTSFAALAVLLLVPFIRFGPRYVTLAVDLVTDRTPHWLDIAMDQDSRDAARIVSHFARPGDTLLVWGYRPNLYVYTRMSSDSLFWDSQPLTGVPADRHLHSSEPIYAGAARNREELSQSRPTFIIDGLTQFNPGLNPNKYPELQNWLSHYELIGRTPLSLIYRRKD